MRAPREEIAHAPDAAPHRAVLEVRGEGDRALVLVDHPGAFELSPVRSELVQVKPPGGTGVGGGPHHRHLRHDAMVELGTVDDREPRCFIIQHQIRQMLVGELRPPSEHEVIRGVVRIPAQQAVGQRRPVLRILEERQCPCLVTGYGRRRGQRPIEVVGRIDGDLGSVVQGHEEPQHRAVEFRIPFELKRVVGCLVGAIEAAGQHQRQDKQDGNGFHVNPPNPGHTDHALRPGRQAAAAGPSGAVASPSGYNADLSSNHLCRSCRKSPNSRSGPPIAATAASSRPLHPAPRERRLGQGEST